MNRRKYIDGWLKGLTCAALVCALALTFTVSDYYIFNRIGQFGFVFSLSQWVKKAGLLLLPLAVFYGKRNSADVSKYVLPIFTLLSCCLFGGFFDITKAADTPAQEIYNAVNLFMPKWLNMTLFFTQNALYFIICALLFVRDGFAVKAESFTLIPPAMLAVIPLNLFENFFDIDAISADSFLRFHNFTLWHFLAIAALAGVTLALYFALKDKPRKIQDEALAAIAIVLLIQYHSKDSLVLGDGYNVYHTVFACIPLFICNIGVYVASLSVFLKKKTLYSIAFFIHAVGALSVFIYFGRDDMSDYGIFCSRSILYFCLTHILLFALSILPSALGHYRFRMRECIIPLVYYFAVIIAASVCSALVTSASMTWHTPDGYYLAPEEWLMPNYAFTQINPFPFEVPNVLTLRIWNYEVNVLYVLGLYAVYVAMFFAFSGVYYSFLAIRKKRLESRISTGQPQIMAVEGDLPSVESEAAISSANGHSETESEAISEDGVLHSKQSNADENGVLHLEQSVTDENGVLHSKNSNADED